MTPARVVVVNEGMPPVSAKLARAFAEDAVAIASWADRQGFGEDAEAMRDFATKVWSALRTTGSDPQVARRAAG